MWEGGEMGGMALADLFRVSMLDGVRTAGKLSSDSPRAGKRLGNLSNNAALFV